MPVIRLSFREKNPVRLAAVALVVIVALVALALNAGTIYRSVTSTAYVADFSEAGGILSGDEVRIGGLKVGTVTGVELVGSHVEVDFVTDDGTDLGDGTTAAIGTATPLGKKFLALTSAGTGELRGGSHIPLSRTKPPYDITQALQTLSSTTQQIDTAQLAQSLDTVAQTFQNTPEALRTALQGVSRLSSTIATRDQALRSLLAQANGVTAVLAQRNQQVTTLLTDGNELLQELYQKRDDLHTLLVEVTSVVDQLKGLAQDNQKELTPALDQLSGVLDLLNSNQDNVNKTIANLQVYATSLGEAVAGGPYFYAIVENLVPTNLAPLLPQVLQQGGQK
ncbi:MCE family protein [Amycolatopsis sp.]|uniref:MCE family protein n=1 Tax=Amycolatopsis sp. TaxID=37632 RepID=UPI002BE720D6|nr:MCE family protein [Amycolatopsis sp.]HVV08204.1 MCE family protein [Amycolatopsis sp.]